MSELRREGLVCRGVGRSERRGGISHCLITVVLVSRPGGFSRARFRIVIDGVFFGYATESCVSPESIRRAFSNSPSDPWRAFRNARIPARASLLHGDRREEWFSRLSYGRNPCLHMRTCIFAAHSPKAWATRRRSSRGRCILWSPCRSPRKAWDESGE